MVGWNVWNNFPHLENFFAYKQSWVRYSLIQQILFNIFNFEADYGIFLFVHRGLKGLVSVLAYFDTFGLFLTHYDLEKLILKNYLQK